MPSSSIESKLVEHGLTFNAAERIGFGRQIRLACGAIINVYDKGTVVVQGKLNPLTRENVLSSLQQILPADTRWGV